MEQINHYWLATLIVVIAGYLLGSVNSAIVITKIYLKKDIRTFGSGNAGTTNVLRSVGKVAGLLTFLGDILKAVVASLIGMYVFKAFALNCGDGEQLFFLMKYGTAFAGTSAVLGHMFPIYYNFKGGKGVVVAGTAMAFIDWRVLMVALGCFIIVVIIKKIVSVSAIAAAIGYFIGTVFFTLCVDYLPNMSTGKYPLSYVLILSINSLVIAGIVIFMHRENIKRLRNGTEKKLSFHKKENK